MNFAQFNAWNGAKPRYAAPAFLTQPFLPQEIYVGDVVMPMTGTWSGYPTPVNLASVQLAGVVVSAPYTIAPGDVGKSLAVVQNLQNEVNVAVAVTTPITIVAPPTAGSLGYVFGNISASNEYSHNSIFGNIIFDSRGFGHIGTLIGSGVTVTNGVANVSGSGCSVTFSATSGVVTATFTDPASRNRFLSGTASDFGRQYTLSDGTIFTVTAYNSTTQCSGTLSQTASGTNFTTFYSALPLDSNHWPTSDCEVLVTTNNLTGVDGQIGPGTYWCRYVSPGQTTQVSANGAAFVGGYIGGVSTSSGGYSVSNVTQLGDGVTTVFQLTITQTAATVVLRFTSTTPSNQRGLSNVIMPRDGTNNFDSCPMFNPAAVNAYATTYNGARFMTFANAIGSLETAWSSRVVAVQNKANEGNLLNGIINRQLAWETQLDFINAIATANNSIFTAAWLNTGGFVDTTYATGLATLINARIAASQFPSTLRVMMELGNEPWNTQYQYFGGYFTLAMNEIQGLGAGIGIVANYAQSPALLYNITRTGGVATAQLASLPPGLTIGQSYPITVNSSPDASYNMGGFVNGSWTTVQATVTSATTVTWNDAGATGSAATVVTGYITNGVLTVQSLSGGTGIVDAGYSVYYAGAPASMTVSSRGTGTGGVGTYNVSSNITYGSAASPVQMTISAFNRTQVVIVFNPASIPLIADGSLNLYNLSPRYLLRQTYRLQNAWNAVRPLTTSADGAPKSDYWIINMQQYGGSPNGSKYPPVHFSFAKTLDGTGNWLKAAAIAPYVACTTTTGSADSGVMALSITTAGSGYVNGVYTNVPLIGGTSGGTSTATVWVANGTVVAAAITSPGTGNAVGKTLTAAASSVGGSGSGLVLTITALNQYSTTGIATLGAVSGGSGYPNGTYNNVPLTTTGAGMGAQATIVVTGGSVTAVTITQRGMGYAVNDTLSAVSTCLGGGTGFATSVSALGGTCLTSGQGMVGDTTTDMNTLFAQLNTTLYGSSNGVPGIGTASAFQNVQNHVYQCKLNNVRPLVYEAEQDLQNLSYNNYGYQITACNDARLGALLYNLMDVCFGLGIKEMALFGSAPVTWTNSQQGAWSCLSSFSDTTSPRIAAINTYRTSKARVYTNMFTPSATDNGPGTIYPGVDYRVAQNGLLNTNTTPNLVYVPHSSTVDNFIDCSFVCNRGNNYKLKVYGMDGQAGTQMQVIIDGTVIGYVVLALGLSGNTSAPTNTVPEVATYYAADGVTVVPYLSCPIKAGSHYIRFVSLHTATGSYPTIYKAAFSINGIAAYAQQVSSITTPAQITANNQNYPLIFAPAVVKGVPAPLVTYDLMSGSTLIQANIVSGTYTPVVQGVPLAIRTTTLNSLGGAQQVGTVVPVGNIATTFGFTMVGDSLSQFGNSTIGLAGTTISRDNAGVVYLSKTNLNAFGDQRVYMANMSDQSLEVVGDMHVIDASTYTIQTNVLNQPLAASTSYGTSGLMSLFSDMTFRGVPARLSTYFKGGARFQGNFGQGGDRADQMINAVTLATARASQYVILDAGINDAKSPGTTAATIVSRIQTLLNIITAANKVAILINITPLSSGYASYGTFNDVSYATNQATKLLCDGTNAIYIDAWSQLVDPATTAGSYAALTNVISSDTVHWNSKGTDLVAKLIWNTIKARTVTYELVPSTKPASVPALTAPGFGTVTRSVGPWPGYSFSTTGFWTGAAGTRMDNWTAGINGAGTTQITCSIYDPNDGKGPFQMASIAVTATTSNISLFPETTSGIPLATSGLSVGDRFVIAAEVIWSNYSASLTSSMYMVCTGTGSGLTDNGWTGVDPNHSENGFTIFADSGQEIWVSGVMTVSPQCTALVPKFLIATTGATPNGQPFSFGARRFHYIKITDPSVG